MENKDYYAALGVDRKAKPEVIKRAYRKLARKYHPDVSKEANAEERFKAVAEAHEALIDPERRAAYDDLSLHQAQAQAQAAQRRQDAPAPPRGWDNGYEYSWRNEMPGADRHAHLDINLADAYHGGRHKLALHQPVIDAQGRVSLQERQLEVNIPAGVRPGQHLRLAGQGEPGRGKAPAGDLYLEIGFRPHAHFSVEGADVFCTLPLAPWDAALGATVSLNTPDGEVQVNIPAGSAAGRRLRLKGKGLPGKLPGDLYALLQINLPKADTAEAREAYAALARAFPDYAAPRPV